MRIIIIILSTAIIAINPVLAATTVTLNVSTAVEEQLSLTFQVFKRDANGNVDGADLAPNIAFGQMEEDGNNGLKGTESYAVVLTANTSQRQYLITSDVSPLVSGAATLPNSMMLSPLVANDLSGNDVQGDTLDTTNRAGVGNNIDIYSSSSAGSSAIIELVYSLPGGDNPFPGAQQIPTDQPSGAYTTSITYTLTLT
jgi:hypothetical protein